jgi:putative ATP-binding cassette transporter
MGPGAVRKSAWKMALGYWISQEKGAAWGLLLMVIGCNCSLVYITVQLNLWQSAFYQVIQNYNHAGFLQEVFKYAVWASLLIMIKGYQLKTRMRLHLGWRTWLTEQYLAKWLRNRVYYSLQLTGGGVTDNPDQRISEDIELFVMLTLRLSLDLLQDGATIISFVIILWDLSGVTYCTIDRYVVPVYGYLVWAALLYAGAGTYCTLKVGKPLIKLDYDQQRYEADFRFSLFKVREYAESIAMYGGESREKSNCRSFFCRIVDNFLQIITVKKKLLWLTTGYTQVSVIFSILVAAPKYFSNQIHLGQMFQIIDAYHHVQNGFSFIIDSFSRLAQWRAVLNRLNHFLLCMEIVHRENAVAQHKRGSDLKFAVENVNVYRPDGHILIKGLQFELFPGERLLLTGPSGSGKSTLLRTIAGFWPYQNGHVLLPRAGEIMFVPQKSYTPIATLRQILLYPLERQTVKDGTLIEMLSACKLEYLSKKLDVALDWGQALSLGEQQKIACVRILFCQPKWLFLDEITSGMDETAEQSIYQLLLLRLPRAAIVSIGHRSSLLTYHKKVLQLDGKSGWRIIDSSTVR